MKQRIVTGLLLAAGLLSLMFWGSGDLVVAVIIALASIACVEFDRLFFESRSHTRRLRLCALVALSILAMRRSVSLGAVTAFLSFIAICVAHVMSAGGEPDFQKTVRSLALEWLGYMYVLCLGGFIVPVFEISSHGPFYLLLLFLIVFGGDTIAYFAGSRFGKRPLASSLSPKKTVEGALAAILLSTLVPAAWFFLVPGLPRSEPLLWKLLLFAPVGSLLGQFGDLLESLFKRSQSIKDSGSIFPGHGGLLDRIDGLALCSPVYYFYLSQVVFPA